MIIIIINLLSEMKINYYPVIHQKVSQENRDAVFSGYFFFFFKQQKTFQIRAKKDNNLILKYKDVLCFLIMD